MRLAALILSRFQRSHIALSNRSGLDFMRIGPLRSTQYSSSRRVSRIPLATSALKIPTLTAYRSTASQLVKSATSIAFDNSGIKLSRLQALIAELQHSYDISPSQPQYTEVLVHRKLSKTVQDVIERTQLAPMTTMTSRILLSGQNNSQISGLYLSRFDSVSQTMIRGSITAVATGASAAINGNVNGKVTHDASYHLTTTSGHYQFKIVQGEDLQTAADRINTDRLRKGVRASVVQNRLVLTTDHLGSAAKLRLLRLDRLLPKVNGVNAAQLAKMRVLAQDAGADETIGGSIISQWSVARLTYAGSNNGKVAGTASFRLSGNAGSAVVSINKGESLTDAAHRLNGQAANTGVNVSVVNNTLQFSSALQGAQSTVQISDVQRANLTSISGVNLQQATSFAVDSFQPSSRESLAGDVVRSASKATLTLQGSENSTVISTATFEVEGGRGSANITIHAGQDLSDAAIRINDVTARTGVTARVQNNRLVFESATSGGAARIAVRLIDLPFTTSVSGRNDQQLASFTPDSFTAASSRTYSGTITQAASEADISHHGSILGVGSTSTFTLTGILGSQSFNTTTFQSLNNLATLVNEKTAQTGVTATVSETDIHFRSIKVGSDAQIRLVVNSGTLKTAGANANGYANGTDARATINGQNLVASGNDFIFADDLGSYRFTGKRDFVGALAPVTVTGSTESFQLSGGDAFGNAYGANARAVVNGVHYDGNVNDFQVATSTGSYRISFAPSYVGRFDPITIQSNVDDFDVIGGDGHGSAKGTDFIAEINGQRFTGNDLTIRYATSVGRYDLTFNEDFLGAFDPIHISTSAGPILSGLGGNGNASGSDARANVNGQDLTAVGSHFAYSDADIDIQFEAQSGFVGHFDPIIVRATQAQEQIISQTMHETVNHRGMPAPSTNSSNTSDKQSDHPRDPQMILGEISSLLAPQVSADQSEDHQKADAGTAFATTSGLSTEQLVARAHTFANLFRTIWHSTFLRDGNSPAYLLDADTEPLESSLNQFA